MSAARYTSKIRTRTEANEQKVQGASRIVNALSLLSASGCVANYSRFNYAIPCPCKPRSSIRSCPCGVTCLLDTIFDGGGATSNFCVIPGTLTYDAGGSATRVCGI